jgi:hypothetical protein
MSTLNHYVPILKWKRAERSALQALADKQKNTVIPLIELVMPTVPHDRMEGGTKNRNRVRKTDQEIFAEMIQKFKDKRVKEIPEEILRSWGTRPLFLDFTLLHEAERTTQLKIDSLNRIVPVGMGIGLKIIPVLNLNDDLQIKKTVASLFKKYDQGICLRVASSDLTDTGTLNKKIEAFLNDFNISRKNTDLLIDIKDDKGNGGQYLKCINASQKIEGLSEWRRFIFASGAFPETLSKCFFDVPNYLSRFDWQNWVRHVKGKTLARDPIFADYTIRTPIFNEALQYYNASPSIKYALENEWLILRGKVHQNEHYLANAKLLVEDMTESFYGEGFSWGDKNIALKAQYFHQYVVGVRDGEIDKGKGTGGSTDWIAWGINHHLILVLNQLANFP